MQSIAVLLNGLVATALLCIVSGNWTLSGAEADPPETNVADSRLNAPVHAYPRHECTTEPWITVSVGSRTYRTPRDYWLSISVGQWAYGPSTWCQPEGDPPEVGRLSFQLRFKGPKAPPELKASLPERIQVFSSHFKDPRDAENYLRVEDGVERGFLPTEPENTPAGNLQYGPFIVQTPGGATTPGGYPLTMRCGSEEQTIRDVYYGALCSTLYRYYDDVMLGYRFHDGLFPEESWDELDKRVRAFLEGLLVPSK